MSPTGYTAPVADGEIKDFRTFALRCARAMGACIMQRDEPTNAPPREQEPSTYHDDARREAEARLVALRSMTVDEIGAACRAEWDKATRQRETYREEKALQRLRYETMLTKVEAWSPPSLDHHGLKEFMLKQLRESIDFDCGGSWEPPFPPASADEWYKAEIRRAERDVRYHTDQARQERERTNERNAWLRALWASLP